MSLSSVNIVWFKRDLRIVDHEPLDLAVNSGHPLILIYMFESSVMEYDDSDTRHWLQADRHRSCRPKPG